jgi:hypothetical protein
LKVYFPLEMSLNMDLSLKMKHTSDKLISFIFKELKFNSVKHGIYCLICSNAV